MTDYPKIEWAKVECPYCGGKNTAHLVMFGVGCSPCNGNGHVYVPASCVRARSTEDGGCNGCGGSGQDIPGRPGCHRCGGSGDANNPGRNFPSSEFRP